MNRIGHDFTLVISSAVGPIMARSYVSKMGAEQFLLLPSTKRELSRKGATRAVIEEATRRGPKRVYETTIGG